MGIRPHLGDNPSREDIARNFADLHPPLDGTQAAVEADGVALIDAVNSAAAMLYGFRMVDDMIDGPAHFMQRHQYRSIADIRGRAIRNPMDWNGLNMNYDLKALSHRDMCIECGRCHIACEDAAHQAIRVDNDECVGCTPLQHVCPVETCIEMNPVANGLPPLTGPEQPRNPLRKGAA